MHHGIAHPHFARSSVSLGSFKYMLGAVVTTMRAEKRKTPEQRYLLMAAVDFGVGLTEILVTPLNSIGSSVPLFPALRLQPIRESEWHDAQQSAKVVVVLALEWREPVSCIPSAQVGAVGDL